VGSELAEVIRATNKSDPSKADKAVLREYIAKHGATEIAQIGRLQGIVISRIMDSTFSGDGNHLWQKSVEIAIEEMKKEFGYDGASLLEQLTIEAILCAWLRYNVVELCCTLVQRESSARAEHWDKRLSMAHRRYLRSLEALARVRRLLHKPSNNVAFNILLKQQLGG
jgi:hypothetical protein